MTRSKISFRVAGGIGNILWQISARAKRFGIHNLLVIPGDKHAADVCDRWLNKEIISVGGDNAGHIDGYFQDKYWLCPSDTIKRWLNLDVAVPESLNQEVTLQTGGRIDTCQLTFVGKCSTCANKKSETA